MNADQEKPDTEARRKPKNLPLINTDDTDQEKPKPLKRGGTEEAEKGKFAADLRGRMLIGKPKNNHKGHEETRRDCQNCQDCQRLKIEKQNL
jgi:hypothetical protein